MSGSSPVRVYWERDIHPPMTDLRLDNPQHLLNLVLDEHREQMEKWGVQTHTPAEWAAIAAEEVGETIQALNWAHWPIGRSMDLVWGHIKKEAIQAATLFLKIAEMAEAGEKSHQDGPKTKGEE